MRDFRVTIPGDDPAPQSGEDARLVHELLCNNTIPYGVPQRRGPDARLMRIRDRAARRGGR